ncbi:MAG: DUF393 domain-containing protein [Caldilineales bacterium]|nr:DUF393 domain-containing protein [Caldilineales bacterium]MDW8318490.1 DUF393 domain-containing protein [Anaerolineae bacterium]
MAERPIDGWVLYDQDCGFCEAWVRYWAPTLRRVGLDVAPLQAPWVAERLGLPYAELVHDVRLLYTDGRHVAGGDVYRHALRRIWWAYPLYLLSVIPGLRQAWDWAYRMFRDNRHRVSATCGLPAPGESARAEG